ncbi:MAG: adenylosuccinate lyase [Candidatus Altiarchaeales archaeon]|nr:MAG: adenylosuccinate lyase [Candidatus Altiarchaeales archaeon]
MTIHPIESRYGRPEVRKIFEEEYRLQKMLDVEAALAIAHSKVGNIPKSAAEEISKKANILHVKLERVKEIESEINHDVMAMVKALAEQCGSSGKYVHLGATSNDITDTALALQFREYLRFLFDDLDRIKNVLLNLANEHKNLVCIGRTHGQHSLPITYGLKFALWACEIQRHIDRINECKERLLVGKMSGAVGTQAAFGKKGIEIQNIVMEILKLRPAIVSNQILQRDRHAEFLLNLALIAETLNKMATEIRNLQRTEIAEVSEKFEKKQVGSSTMPHKRNPIHAERICGLSRVIKSNAIASLDNIPLWHERDLTNSSCERIIIPEACILTDYILNLCINLLKNLEFNYANIERNLELTRGRIMSESVMILLVEKGIGRQEAHEIIRRCAMESYEKNIPFRDVLMKNSHVLKHVTADELDMALDPKRYIGTASQQVDIVLRELGFIHKM